MVKFIFQGNIKSNFIFSTIKKQEKLELFIERIKFQKIFHLTQGKKKIFYC